MDSYVKVTSTQKSEIYREIIPQIHALLDGEDNLIANLGNAAAALKLAFPTVSWVGFYLRSGEDLVLGPFQGKPACVRIRWGKGVCGSAAASRSTIIVPNVHEFPGHIFCDPDSKSEIVVPLIRDGEVLGVLDLDSSDYATFDETDREYLVKLAERLIRCF
jgi:GAF domain-containing protein